MALSVLGSTAAMFTAWRISPSVQEANQQVHGLDGHQRLRLFRAGAQVRRAEHAGHAEQRAVRARLGFKHVQRHAGQFAALQSLHQRLLVIDAAARRVDQPRARLEQLDLPGCRSGAWSPG